MSIAAPLVLRPNDEAKLLALTLSTTVEAGLAQRARIVLLASQGLSNTEICRRGRAVAPDGDPWRCRFQTGGIAKAIR